MSSQSPETVPLPDTAPDGEVTENNIAPLRDTDVEIPVYNPDGTASVEVAETKSVAVVDIWQEEKQRISIFDPIKNVVDRVKIFFAGQTIDHAMQEMKALEGRSQSYEDRYAKLETMVKNAEQAAATMDAAREASGLGKMSQETAMKRRADMESARAQMEAIGQATLTLDRRAGEIAGRKAVFEQTRNEAKQRIIDRIQLKVDREERTIADYEQRHAEAVGNIEECGRSIVALQEQEQLLHQAMGEEMLPAHAREIRSVQTLVNFQIVQAERVKKQHETQRTLLGQKMNEVKKRRNDLQAKIAPPKQKDVVPDKSSKEQEVLAKTESSDDPFKDTEAQSAADTPGDLLPELSDEELEQKFNASRAAAEAQEKLKAEPVSTPDAKQETRPVNIISALTRLREEAREVPDDEEHSFTSAFGELTRKHQER